MFVFADPCCQLLLTSLRLARAPRLIRSCAPRTSWSASLLPCPKWVLLMLRCWCPSTCWLVFHRLPSRPVGQSIRLLRIGHFDWIGYFRFTSTLDLIGSLQLVLFSTLHYICPCSSLGLQSVSSILFDSVTSLDLLSFSTPWFSWLNSPHSRSIYTGLPPPGTFQLL